MSNTEDYLDGLLNSVEGKPNKNVEPEMPTEGLHLGEETDLDLFVSEEKDEEQEFLDSFEQEFLAGEDTDEFIRQFERELDEEEQKPSVDAAPENELLNDIHAMMNHTTEDMSASSEHEEEEDLDFMVNTLEDVPEDVQEEEPDISSDFDTASPEFPEMEEESGEEEDDSDLMSLLQAEGDFSDIGDALQPEDADAENAEGTERQDDFGDSLDDLTLEEVPIDEPMVLEDEVKESAEGSAEKSNTKSKKEASGFLKKISQVLFGEEEQEESVEEAEPVKEAASVLTSNIEDLSDENLALLQELEGTGATKAEEPQEKPETEEEAKARKKREKEEQKAKKKAEKAEKKAQAKAAKAEKKAKKEKKPKKPKEPDNTPPLPRKPVILCFLMAASFLVLVMLGTNLFGYSSSMENAEKQFGLGNYTEAYQQVSGLDIKEQDDAIYEKYRVMGNIAGEYSAYQTFMEAGIYDMALDSLVRTVGRCQKYEPDAEVYGCAGELSKVREQAVGALAGFGITEERALELYTQEEREEYSAELNVIVEQAGYTID